MIFKINPSDLLTTLTLDSIGNYTIKSTIRNYDVKGKLVYEYNPFRNFIRNGKVSSLSTSELNFDLNHPIDIKCQPSYDGSVNLILNDGKNQPKLINSRFSPRERNTYEIIDRFGNNDTNLYDEKQFNIDTSLYKRVIAIPKLSFLGLQEDGNLPVGNYVFYLKYADADGNETDFIEESGIVSCHIGNINNPKSIRGGLSNENSQKSALFNISNLDVNYEYVKVYYTRSTSNLDGVEITTAHKIDKNFNISGGITNIKITGFENSLPIDLNEINVKYNVISSSQSQSICQNMLFMGNVKKANINYKELKDLALHFLPETTSINIGNVNSNYIDNTGKYEYYNALNIYNYLGYWNEELYRLGVVFILEDNTLSPVFNIRGKDLSENNLYTNFSVNSSGERSYIPIDENDYSIGTKKLENSKGVIKVNSSKNQIDVDGVNAIGIRVKISNEAIIELKKYSKGFFFVRQKRIPNILAQAYTIGLDRQSCLPMLPLPGNKFLAESFVDSNCLLLQNYNLRKLELVNTNGQLIKTKAALCPEYELRSSYFNGIFAGNSYVIQESKFGPNNYVSNGEYSRLYQFDGFKPITDTNLFRNVKIITIGDNVQLQVNGDQKYRSRAGVAEEAYKFEYLLSEDKLQFEGKTKNKHNKIIRGAFGPYLGLDGYNGDSGRLINIMIPNYSEGKTHEYFKIRYDDNSPYYAISNRVDLEKVSNNFFIDCYRGDCFIGNFTHRMNRNFQDPEAPTNDIIIDNKTFVDNYKFGNSENNGKINRGDINAIELGHWVTMKVCSNINVSFRDIDISHPEEENLTGKPRGFYPYQSISASGESKIPESGVMNQGLNSTTSDRYNFIMPDVPAIKNNFETRIMYSDVNINEAFQNGFRTFRSQNYRDYPRTYGSIVKLVELQGNILCIFEHGISIIPVNERALVGNGQGGNIFVNTSNVLPENPKVISDTFGTLWSESVIKTSQYVYGVDTVAKKIWRTNGQHLEIISDFKVQKFLNDNISLSERETTPIIGIRNVKTHFNRFKNDVMFTFYDNTFGFEEKVWNLCFNEVTNKFSTFYSWVPSYSENIDNVFFSFDRNTSRQIAKIWNTKNPSNGFIYISSNEINTHVQDSVIGTLSLNEELKSGATVNFSIEPDNFGYYKYFKIVGNNLVIAQELPNHFEGSIEKLNPAIYQLNIKANLTFNTSSADYRESDKSYYTNNIGYYQQRLFLYTIGVENTLTTNFWKHGFAGNIDIQEELKPTHWYGKQHPFELEFVVLDNPSVHKIFDNLEIISNKAEPESFHFEIVGEVYIFAEDKKNLFFRQEAIKHIYQHNGGDIQFNRDYLNITPEQRKLKYNLSYPDQSIMFPINYSRVDTFNEIEDFYQSISTGNKNYNHMSGSEIIYDKQLNEFRIATHIAANSFDGWYKEGEVWKQYGRLRGNMHYVEDKWLAQIPSIHYFFKNEQWWAINGGTFPPINLANNPLPESMPSLSLSSIDDLPKELVEKGYKLDNISFDISSWKENRKETKIRDKYVKIRIRYSGKDLAIISAIKTLFTISYA